MTMRDDRFEQEDGLRIAVLIVSYNAEKTIQSVLDRIPDALWSKIENVLIFDDCSKDETAEQSKTWQGRYADKVILFENQVNLGYGGNQKRGYRYCIEQGYDVVVLLHGDGQYAPECMADLIDPITEGRAQACFGSRMMESGKALKGGMPFYKYIGNKVLTGFQNFVLPDRLSEFHSGYRAYDVHTLARLPLLENTNDFHFDTEIIIQLMAAEAHIEEVPIPTYYGDEICHVNGMRYAKDVAFTTLTYAIHKAGLAYDKRFDLGDGTKYTFKHNRYSSHNQILELLAEYSGTNDPNPSQAHVLDIGCGSALLAAMMKQQGHHVTGIDVYFDEMANERCDHFVAADLEAGLGPIAERKYDHIVLADVIEHVRDPEHLVVETSELLEEDGTIIASTGNVGHIFIRLMLFFGRFEYAERGILDRTHVRLFTPGSFKRLIEDTSCEIVERRYCPIPFENIIPGHRRLTDALTWMYMGFVKVWPSLFAYQVILVAKPDFDNPGRLTRERQIHKQYEPS